MNDKSDRIRKMIQWSEYHQQSVTKVTVSVLFHHPHSTLPFIFPLPLSFPIACKCDCSTSLHSFSYFPSQPPEYYIGTSSSSISFLRILYKHLTFSDFLLQNTLEALHVVAFPSPEYSRSCTAPWKASNANNLFLFNFLIFFLFH